MQLVRTMLCAVVLAAPATVFANDYISTDTNDWYRYTNTVTGQEVTSQITYDLGGWRQWSNWAGMGSTWVYTTDSHDWFWLWNGTTYQLINNLDGQYTAGIAADLKGCNQQSTVRFADKVTKQFPAGAFNDVSTLTLTTSCADAGTSSISFAKGIGMVGWTEQSFMGPQTWELTAAQVGGRQYPQAGTNPPPSGGTRPVAASEHDAMESILWGANDTYLVMDTYTDAFPRLQNNGVGVQVAVSSRSVSSQLQYELAQNGVSTNSVEFLVVALDSVWMRDYGPIVLKRPNGDRVVGDPNYYWNRRNDDDFPIAYANYRGWDRVHVDLDFEGGNFATDGQGLAVVSNGVRWFNQGMSVAAIRDEFEKLGCDTVEFLEPLIDEGTTHVDMFMRVMDDNTALVSRYPSSHRQSTICNAAVAQLQALGYQVIRADVDYSYDEFATYTNSVLANGIALVPQYTSSSRNFNALQAYESAGYTAYGVDSRLIIQYSGATHCLSMQIPAGN